MKREERIRKSISFSFLEKGVVVVSLLIAGIAGYFMPVGIVLKFILGVAVFVFLIMGWMFIENLAQDDKNDKISNKKERGDGPGSTYFF